VPKPSFDQGYLQPVLAQLPAQLASEPRDRGWRRPQRARILVRSGHLWPADPEISFGGHNALQSKIQGPTEIKARPEDLDPPNLLRI
jgi:hypothetical protein